jgi:hypothetical protein
MHVGIHQANKMPAVCHSPVPCSVSLPARHATAPPRPGGFGRESPSASPSSPGQTVQLACVRLAISLGGLPPPPPPSAPLLLFNLPGRFRPQYFLYFVTRTGVT